VKNRISILIELEGLGSRLGNINAQNIYEVPSGYFEELTQQILNRINALEASDPKEELEILSPSLNRISKEMPLQVPAGYFENLGEQVIQSIHEQASFQTSNEEIASLSPLLSSISKKIPYQVPAGYFENLDAGTVKIEETKIISIKSRSWYRVAAAAAFIGFITFGALLFLSPNKIDPIKNPEKWVARNVEKKVSSQQLDEFVKLATGDDNLKYLKDNEPVRTEEMKELMKDVSEKEIQEFLNEAIVVGPNTDADALMN
jgi:hypothetical protein